MPVKSPRAIRYLTIASVVIVALSAVSWLGFGLITNSIKRVDAFAGIQDRPEKPTSAVNYLIVGSDSREGLTRAEQRRLRTGSTKVAAGKRSDTMLMVHISKNRDRAAIISIPRDSYALIPSWTDSSGDLRSETYSKINSAFAWGGAPLLIKTLESMSDVRIDHYIEVDFTGFVRIVDALGGVEICTPRAINDPKSHLTLSAGRHQLDGIDSLKYVRARSFDGTADLGRMKRQQQFVSTILREVTSAGVLLNPVTMTRLLNSAFDSVITDEGLDRNDLLTLGKQLRNLSAKNVNTLTVPLKYYNYNKNGVTAAVLWDPELSADLFQRIREDRPLIDEVKPSPSASTSASTSASGDSKKAQKKPETVYIDKFGTETASTNPCKGF
jgi:LCP family protein required for cell wall assembly